MRIIVFDTETTGLPDWRAPSSDPGQPHIVQLAWATFGDDGSRLGSRNRIIRPEGWTIPAEASAIHRITHELAMDTGLPAAEVIEEFLEERREAVLRVAHNISFDDRMLRIDLLRHGLERDAIEAMEREPKFCTMAEASKIMKMKPTDRMLAAGFTKPKPPKLIEAMQHFFSEGLDGAHDAEVDVIACGRLFFHLRGLAAAAAAAAEAKEAAA